MAFNTALSGIRAAGADLDIIGNNVANAGTVGFKAARGEFADIYAASTLGTSALAIGSGVRLSDVAQQFKWGNINFTDNPLDIAINGDGFFRLNDGGAIVYTRAGMFKRDDEGYIINNDGYRLTGYLADGRGNITGQIGDLRLDNSIIMPRATDDVFATLNLNANEAEPSTPWPATVDPDNPPPADTYNWATSLTVFDSLGNGHIMSMYFRKLDADATATPPIGDNTWEVHVLVDGNEATATPHRLEFDSSGVLSTGATMSIVNHALGNGAAPLSFDISFNGTTQSGSAFAINGLNQTGYTTGRMTSLDIDPSGILYARYSNGESKAMGQVVLANFTNPQGLQPLGNTTWGETAASGLPLVGTPGTSNLGVVQGGALEDSNVDLTQELIKMIVAQRNYQANAQTIRTEDAVTQAIINIR